MAESRKIDEPVTFSTFLLFSCFFSSLRVLSENENESDLILFVSSEKLLSFDFFYPGKSIYRKGKPLFEKWSVQTGISRLAGVEGVNACPDGLGHFFVHVQIWAISFGLYC